MGEDWFVAIIFFGVAGVALGGLFLLGRRAFGRELEAWLGAEAFPEADAGTFRPPFAEKEVPDAAIERVIARLESRLSPGRMVRQGEDFEWRASVAERPLRVSVRNGGRGVKVELMAPNPVEAWVVLDWDPTRVPKPEQSDPWDGPPLLFVARGVFLSTVYRMGDDGDAVMRRRTDQWARFPEPLKEAIVSLVYACEVRRFELDDGRIEAEIRGGLQRLSRPIAQLERLARGMRAIADELAVLPSESIAPVDSPPAERATCTYCRSVFTWSVAAACPNCGAPVQDG